LITKYLRDKDIVSTVKNNIPQAFFCLCLEATLAEKLSVIIQHYNQKMATTRPDEVKFDATRIMKHYVDCYLIIQQDKLALNIERFGEVLAFTVDKYRNRYMITADAEAFIVSDVLKKNELETAYEQFRKMVFLELPNFNIVYTTIKQYLSTFDFLQNTESLNEYVATIIPTLY